MAHYGSAASVKTRTGVGPDDLGLEDDAALDALIGELLDEATDLINRRMRRSWNDEAAAGTIPEVPAGLNGIANDVVAQSVRDMVATRQTPVVRIDEFAVTTLASRIFTPDIEKRLRLYGSSAVSTIAVTPGDMAETSTSITAAQLDTMDD